MITAEQLKNAIKGKGYTIDLAAQKLGISRQQFYNNLNKPELDPKFVEQVEEVLDIDITEGAAASRRQLKRLGRPYLKEVDGFGADKRFDITKEDVTEFISDYIYIPEFTKADFYINVRGHSMYPKYASGEIISLKRVMDINEIQYGQVYVVVTDENRVIKYVRKSDNDKKLLLVSENPKFDAYEVERKNVRALFLVLGKISKDVL